MSVDIDNIVADKLLHIHGKLDKFVPLHELRREIPEQIMACNFIKEDDCVLELGGSIGRNSCVINTILKYKKQHVVLEPSITEASRLLTNKTNNNLEFQIEQSALSDKPLYSKGWYTYTENIEGTVQVNTITYEQLKNKYDLSFNVLVVDNEGNFVSTLKSYPSILDNIRLLLIEHDFNSKEDLHFFNETMLTNGFHLERKYMKNDKYGPGDRWSDGVIGDPIFVSAWLR